MHISTLELTNLYVGKNAHHQTFILSIFSPEINQYTFICTTLYNIQLHPKMGLSYQNKIKKNIRRGTTVARRRSPLE